MSEDEIRLSCLQLAHSASFEHSHLTASNQAPGSTKEVIDRAIAYHKFVMGMSD